MAYSECMNATTQSRETTISVLDPDSSTALQAAAAWRYDAFLANHGYTVEDSAAQLTKLVTDPSPGEAALIAYMGGRPAGVCLLVARELDDLHDLTPWLASLYVAPEFRGLGVARQLIAAIEDKARAAGFPALYLYTGEARPLYEKCGWHVREHLHDKAGACVLMERRLTAG